MSLRIISIASIALLGLGVLFLGGDYSSKAHTALEATPSPVWENVPFVVSEGEANYFPIRDWTVADPLFDARSVLAYFRGSKKTLFEYKSDTLLPIASITKIMTALVAWENLPLDGEAIVSAEAIAKTRAFEGNSDMLAGERFLVMDLLRFMLIKSSNDAAYALEQYASSQGIDMLGLMNNKAKEIGMNATNFKDVAGLDDSGNSTVQDLVKLVDYSLQYEPLYGILRTVKEIIPSLSSGRQYTINNTNQLLNHYPVVGGKTGFTDNSLGTMLLVTTPPSGKGEVISIILGSNDRFGDMKKLVDWMHTAYRWQ